MKNIIYLFSLCLVLTSCGQECEVESNGFAPMEGQTVMMGSQASVDVVIAMDKVWAERDYDALKSFIADGASLQFYNGTTASNGEEFVAIIEKQYQRAISILKKNKKKLIELAEVLLTKEVIFKDNLEEIFGKRPFDKQEVANKKKK